MRQASATYQQGGDARAIRDIADNVYGGYRQMFDAHGWDAPGNKLMTSAPALIVERYGSIHAFETAHRVPPSGNDIWDRGYSVLLTSFWGWTPETWGTVGWTGERGRTRRANLLTELTDPFICVIYITSNQSALDPALKGKVAGFYLVSHVTGDRDDFTHPIHHGREVDKWRHSLRALRAFSYLPEHRLGITTLDPNLLPRARSVSAMGEVITDPDQMTLLKETPWVEVEVYKSGVTSPPAAAPDDAPRGLVQAGPASDAGYVVANGSEWTPRELYVLRLDGDADAYLGRSADGRSIIKIGLSASPDLRRQTIQKAMPRGAFRWQVERTTASSGLSTYPSHSVAVKGEDAMKSYLATHAEWLGGEFYLATNNDIETAWQLGCQAAANHIK